MSEHSCGAIKLNNGPNGRIKTNGFSRSDFGLRPPETHSWPLRASQTPD